VIGQMITWGIGTPSSIAMLTLVGLSTNPEVRDAEILALVGLYDASLLLDGVYDDTVALRGVYDDTLPLTGEL